MVKKYVLFTTPTCVACPPVKKYLAELETKGMLSGQNYNVASDEGYEQAVTCNVTRSPTVIFFDQNNREVARANNVSEIKSIIYDY
ncbi:MAG: hypothetical protein AABX38_01105 [Candidatus Micrarchaeota archaeon]